MNQFIFDGKEKRLSFILMGIGIVSLLIPIISAMVGSDGDVQMARVWSNILHNAVFFTGIAFIMLFFWAAHTVGFSGWHVAIRRIWEAIASFLPVGALIIVLTVIGVWGGFHHMYEWADPAIVKNDPILQGKSAMLNKVVYTIATLVILGSWVWFYRRLRSLSVQQDADKDIAIYKKSKRWSAIFLPVAGVTSFFGIVFWVMSIDPHWYSTLYAWYNGASWLVAGCGVTVILMVFLKNKGYLPAVNDSHFHDMGKYMFGFSIFWTYLWFSQFMLIWYANVGEETVYFDIRLNSFWALFFGNLVLNFFLPFLILMRNTSKRRYGIMVFVAGLVIFGHWIDFFQEVKPGVLHALHVHHEAHKGHDSHKEDEKHSDATIDYQEPRAVLTSGEDEKHGDKKEETDKKHGDEHSGHGEESHGGHDDHGSDFVMGFHFPGLIEIGTFLGFIGLFMFIVLGTLAKASLAPKNDPFFAESDNHHYDVQGF